MKRKKWRPRTVDFAIAGFALFFVTTTALAFVHPPEFIRAIGKQDRTAEQQAEYDASYGRYAEEQCSKEDAPAYCADFQMFVKTSPAYDPAAVTRWRDTYYVNFCSHDAIWRWKNRFNINEGKERVPGLEWCDPYLAYMSEDGKNPAFNLEARDQWLKKTHVYACYGKDNFYLNRSGCWRYGIRKSWRIDPKEYAAELEEQNKAREQFNALSSPKTSQTQQKE